MDEWRDDVVGAGGAATAPAGRPPATPVAGGRPPRHGRGRRRWAVGLVAGLAVVAAAVAVVVSRGGEGVPGLPPVVVPAPTPTVTAAARDTTTAFQRALPDEVVAFAVAAQEEAEDLLDAGAVEAYALVYTDGAQQVTLRAAQWPTADEAVGAMSALLAAQPPGPSPGTATPATTLRDEPVEVGGEAVGRVIVVVDGATARATWTSGSTLLRLDGPAGAVPSFHDAFPM
jgi:hypothetical protein